MSDNNNTDNDNNEQAKSEMQMRIHLANRKTHDTKPKTGTNIHTMPTLLLVPKN